MQNILENIIAEKMLDIIKINKNNFLNIIYMQPPFQFSDVKDNADFIIKSNISPDKYIEHFINYTKEILKNKITTDVKEKLEYNYALALLLNIYSQLALNMQLLTQLTILYLNMDKKIGLAIIFRVLKLFESQPQLDNFMRDFKWDILVKELKINKSNLFDNSGPKKISNNKLNNNNTIVTTVTPIPIITSIQKPVTQINTTKLDPQNSNNRRIIKEMCMKEIKIPKTFYGTNTPEYKKCKNETPHYVKTITRY